MTTPAERERMLAATLPPIERAKRLRNLLLDEVFDLTLEAGRQGETQREQTTLRIELLQQACELLEFVGKDVPRASDTSMKEVS